MKPARKKRKAALLGLGLDGEDGHTRLTRGDNFVLSADRKKRTRPMQETAIKLNEQLDRRGRRLEDVSPRICRNLAGNSRSLTGAGFRLPAGYLQQRRWNRPPFWRLSPFATLKPSAEWGMS